MHDRKDDVRDVGLEALGNNVSGARGDSGADASHRTVQAWMGSDEKTAREGPQNPRKGKRAQPTAGERAYPTARERTKATGDQLRRSWRCHVWWNAKFRLFKAVQRQ